MIKKYPSLTEFCVIIKSDCNVILIGDRLFKNKLSYHGKNKFRVIGHFFTNRVGLKFKNENR